MIDATIKGLGIRPAPTGKPLQPSGAAVGFADALKGAVAETSKLQREADGAAMNVLAGDAGSLHHAMIALEKANVSFRTLLQVRNRVLEAYQEIMRMQV
ncbi:MAG: flagellar hook-basal body complex protein FliE [Syntrophus sp. (in: bacteria)]|nr:flagellar hook-basal body complex protein FliE [Syntrophus sp. (in: bacteria)]